MIFFWIKNKIKKYFVFQQLIFVAILIFNLCDSVALPKHINIYNVSYWDYSRSCRTPVFTLSDLDFETNTIFGYIRQNMSNNFHSTLVFDDGRAIEGSCQGPDLILTKGVIYKGFGFCMKDPAVDVSSSIFGQKDCDYVNLEIDQSIKLGDIKTKMAEDPMLKDIIFTVTHYNDLLCLTMPTSRGQTPLLCRGLNSKSEEEIVDDERKKEKCKQVGRGCYNLSNKSQSPFNFSGQTFHCLTETLDRVFFEEENCIPEGDTNFTSLTIFPKFLDKLRNIIQIILSLYVTVFAIKIIMNPQEFSGSKVIMFILKMIFVIYFSIGFGKPTSDTRKTNGVVELLPIAIQISNRFADIIFSAANVQGLCQFPSDRYEQKYQFYKLWDSIDCRIAHYFGVKLMSNNDNGHDLFKDEYKAGTSGDNGTEPIKVNTSPGESPSSLREVGVFAFAGLISGLMLAGHLIVFISFLVFFVLLISIMISVFATYAICIITLYALAYVSPIFVTMFLFDRTRQYFDSWLKLIISCILQPAIILGFVGLLLTLCDRQIYQKCEFKRHDYDVPVKSSSVVSDKHTQKISTFEIRSRSGSYKECEESIGVKILKYTSGGDGWEKHLLLFIPVVSLRDVLDVGNGILIILAFMIIFYFLSREMNSFAAALTDGIDVTRIVISPTKIFDVMKKKAEQAASFAKSAALKAVKGGAGAAGDAVKDRASDAAKDKISDSDKGDDGDKTSSNGDSESRRINDKASSK